ncbi:SGNH/GDSL hydrolase family protein [Paenibacillaceae bacterium WGS1546]|uniref:SGNH/GDSL hydrolase family protein n=1 Tax=Cohnella sp. WGS1546 TaxID=3366810 RepID=UPI00372CEA2E
MTDNELAWHSPLDAPFRVNGFPWLERDGVYRRLPLAPEFELPPAVDRLADNTAGGQIRFRTNSGRLSVKVRLNGTANMNHMPATGQCGFDCYLGGPGEQKYMNTTKFDPTKPEYEFSMYGKIEPGFHSVTLYFPLYIGVEEVLVGLDPWAEVAAPLPYSTDKRIVFYGTSITQGGCASRPGMAYTNALSRKIDAEFVNLGFSGSGKGEAEVAHAVSGVPDPMLLVLDYEANSVSPELLQSTLPEFIRIYRLKHPEVPILVLSQFRYPREPFDPELRELRLARKRIQRETVNALRRRGDRNVHFHDGERLLGNAFNECTVDGTHPTDLGFYQMAEGLYPVIKRLLS